MLLEAMTNENSSAKFTQVLFYLDIGQRIISILTHVIYLLIVLKCKALRKKSFLFIHNFMFTNFIYCGYFLYHIRNEKPNISYFHMSISNHTVCLIASTIWLYLKYLRFYSIVLVSVHRFIAVYHINLFKRINSSKLILCMCILIVWAFSGFIFFLTKYFFHTTHGINNCFDGYSSNFNVSLNYYIFSVAIGSAFPTVCVVVIYILIYRKLKRLEKHLSMKSSTVSKIVDSNLETTNHHIESKLLIGNEVGSITNLNMILNNKNQNLKRSGTKFIKTSRKAHSRYANQFLTINILLIISFIALSFGSARNFINSFNDNHYYITQICRIINMFSSSLVPISSLIYHKN